MTVYEFSLVLSAAPTLQTKFVLAILPNWIIIPDKTNVDIERAITWGWQNAFLGRWPTTDHLGRSITEAHGQSRYWRHGNVMFGVWEGIWLKLDGVAAQAGRKQGKSLSGHQGTRHLTEGRLNGSPSSL
jgi:hypothetical protein